MRELSGSVLILSIDWPLPAANSTASGEPQLGGRFADLLDFYQLPATWGVSEPPLGGKSAANPSQELALLADTAWAGPQVGRSVFHRELERRLGAVRRASLEVTSLIVADGAPPEHCDLMQKLGLKAVRGAQPATTGGDWPPPRSLRFGLWELPASLRFPARGWLGSLRLARRARHWIDQAVRTQRPLHIVFDGQRLSEGGLLAMRLADSVLRLAVRRREEGLLRVETMAGAVAQPGPQSGAGSARSILRPRAA
jgi:hypothetical protein